MKLEHGVLRTTPFAGTLVGPAAGDGDGLEVGVAAGSIGVLRASSSASGRSKLGKTCRTRTNAGSFIEHGRALKVREKVPDALDVLAGAESAIGHDAQQQAGQSLFAGWGSHQLHMAHSGGHPGGAAELGGGGLAVDEGDDILGQIQ